MRLWPIAFGIIAASAAFAQAPVRVTANVVDKTSRKPIDGASVFVDNVLTPTVSARGTFQIEVASGRVTVGISAPGYSPWQRELFLRQDTTITVELASRDVVLDTVYAEAGTVKARITFRDADTKALLVDVAATSGTGETRVTNHSGAVTLTIPRGARTTVFMEGFAYLPRLDSVQLQDDTSYTVMLKVNEGALKLIEEQNARLAERMKGRFVAGRTALTRKEITASSDGSLGEVLKREGFFRNVACTVVDDQPIRIKTGLGYLLPERIERVERLQFGRAVMLRVYTREYIRDLILGLKKPGPVVFSGGGKFCR
jgi:hypothetical protein